MNIIIGKYDSAAFVDALADIIRNDDDRTLSALELNENTDMILPLVHAVISCAISITLTSFREQHAPLPYRLALALSIVCNDNILNSIADDDRSDLYDLQNWLCVRLMCDRDSIRDRLDDLTMREYRNLRNAINQAITMCMNYLKTNA